MVDEPQRPVINGGGKDSVSILRYFEELRHSDQRSLDDRITEINLRNQQRYEQQQAGIGTAMVASKEAVDKAEQTQAKQNALVEASRQLLDDRLKLMWPVSEGQRAIATLEDKLITARDVELRAQTTRFEATEDRLSALERLQATAQGRASMLAVVAATAMFLVTVALTVTLRFYH